MIRAPSVNQIRFLSSVALEKAPKLILEASCSAADAIWDLPGWTYLSGLRLLCRYRGSRLGGSLLRYLDLDAAAGLLHRGDGRLGGTGDLDHQFRLQLALSKQAHTVALAADHAGRHHGSAIDGVAGRKPAGLDRLLQPADIDLHIVEAVDVVEAALGHAHVERHLAALEAVDGHARARRLALAATPCGLALARADAAPDAHAR